MFQLFNNKIEINSVDLEGVTSNINRDSVSVFNFDYIISIQSKSRHNPDDILTRKHQSGYDKPESTLMLFQNRLFRQTKAPRKPHQNFWEKWTSKSPDYY
jgi:hypothetical protein